MLNSVRRRYGRLTLLYQVLKCEVDTVRCLHFRPAWAPAAVEWAIGTDLFSDSMTRFLHQWFDWLQSSAVKWHLLYILYVISQLNFAASQITGAKAWSSSQRTDQSQWPILQLLEPMHVWNEDISSCSQTESKNDIESLSSPVVSNGYTSQCSGPYWSNPLFLVFQHSCTLALRTECQSARMSNN